MNWQETREFLSPCFPEPVRSELELLQPGELREIRIRADRPTLFVTATRTAALDWAPGQYQLEALIEGLSEHSLYARTPETSQGFLTLRGGHRMGLCGRVVRHGGQAALTGVGSVCIRIAAEWPGCASALIPRMIEGTRLCSVLIIGLPGTGKTTLLRDLARQLSGMKPAVQTAIIDERGEISACLEGVPQLDVGPATDVLDGLPKPEAVAWLIRSMAPRMVITDELAGPDDAAAVLDAIACGASVCASVHGSSLQEVASRPAMAALISRRAFDLYAILSPAGGGCITALHDRSGNPMSVS